MVESRSNLWWGLKCGSVIFAQRPGLVLRLLFPLILRQLSFGLVPEAYVVRNTAVCLLSCSPSSIRVGSISYNSSATTMPIATTPTPQPLVSTTLPPPQTFDFLPPLHALLSRLLLPRDSIDPSSPSSDTLTPISPKELGAAASAITNKIQKARVIVKELPGTDMSVQQQEIAINELESEVKRLESRIEDVREKARTWVGAGSGTLGGKGDEEAMEE